MINKDSKKLETNAYRSLIGDNIKLFREEKGYSQEELAGLMNISRTTISKIESGKFAITVDYIEKFSHFLDFDISLNRKQKN